MTAARSFPQNEVLYNPDDLTDGNVNFNDDSTLNLADVGTDDTGNNPPIDEKNPDSHGSYEILYLFLSSNGL